MLQTERVDLLDLLEGETECGCADDGAVELVWEALDLGPAITAAFGASCRQSD